MKTNELKIIGRIVDKQMPVDLLLGNSEGETEIQQIDFAIHADCGLVVQATARSDVGSAFHAFNVDTRFAEGARILATGYLIGGITDTQMIAEILTAETAHTMLEAEIDAVDLQALIDKAESHMMLKQAELFQLLGAFEEGTPQHYAIATQLRRGHKVKGHATRIAEKVCLCHECRKIFRFISPLQAFKYGRALCSHCGKNVAFDLVDPLPRDPEDEKEQLSLDDIQEQLRKRFEK